MHQKVASPPHLNWIHAFKWQQAMTIKVLCDKLTVEEAFYLLMVRFNPAVWTNSTCMLLDSLQLTATVPSLCNRIEGMTPSVTCLISFKLQDSRIRACFTVIILKCHSSQTCLASCMWYRHWCSDLITDSKPCCENPFGHFFHIIMAHECLEWKGECSTRTCYYKCQLQGLFIWAGTHRGNCLWPSKMKH